MLWLAAGVLVGVGFQLFLDGPATSGINVTDVPNATGARILSSSTKKGRGDISIGDTLIAVTTHRGETTEKRHTVSNAADYISIMEGAKNGDVAWHHLEGITRPVPVNLSLSPTSQRATWIRPFALAADLFLRLLKMLIVPIILTSIITGVVGVGGGKDLKRMGLKTFTYYVATSMLAILTALILVNLIRPGKGAALGLTYDTGFQKFEDASFIEVILRMLGI